VIAGLSDAEAAARLRRFGPNELAPPRRLAVLQELTRDLVNPLVLVLLLASTVVAAFGQFVSAALTAAMVVLSVALNFVQSYRSQQAAQRERVGQTATVERDGALRDVPVRDVVPGDVVHLAAGDLVPADARLREAKDLFLNDASHVVAQLAGRPPETEFERGTRRFGLLILKIVVFLVLFVFLVNALLRREALESFLFAVALAVGLAPELLPMIVSVTLAAGAVRMARQKVIVKRLAAIENFGSMDVLCSDKTGTLTVGQIAVDRHVNLRGEEDETVIRLTALNSAFQTGLRSPMDDAILRHEHPAVADYQRIDEVPFDFSRRRVSIAVDGPDGRSLVTKGAPEGVLALCTTVALDGRSAPFDAEARARAAALFEDLSREGFRVLAIAARPVAPQPAYGVADERDLTLIGFAAFLEPPRTDVGETSAPSATTVSRSRSSPATTSW
jgi:P-type Mg2+ transporter